jgi:hypothetical protein
MSSPDLVSASDGGEAIAGAALRFFAADADVQAAAVREALAIVEPPPFRGKGATLADTYLIGVACVYITYWGHLSDAHPTEALEPLQDVNAALGHLTFQGWKWRHVDFAGEDWTRLRLCARRAMQVLGWSPGGPAAVFDVDELIAVDQFQATDEQIRILCDDRVEVLMWKPSSPLLAYELLFRQVGAFVVACVHGPDAPIDLDGCAEYAREAGFVAAGYRPSLRRVGAFRMHDSLVGDASVELLEACSLDDARLLAHERAGGSYQVALPAGVDADAVESLLRDAQHLRSRDGVGRIEAAKAKLAWSAWPYPAGSEHARDLVFVSGDAGWLAILATAAGSAGEREFASFDRWRRFGLHADSAVVPGGLEEYAALG